MPCELHHSEAERLSALHRYRILDTPAEQAFDDAVQLASMVCGTPISLITLLDESRQWFKAKVGIDASETPREWACCDHAIKSTGLTVVSDAAQDERFAANRWVTGDPGIRFYAGAPLVTGDGYALGTLCVIDRVPRELTQQQKDALLAISRQVVTQLELRTKTLQLGQVDEDHKRVEQQLRDSEQRYRAVVDNVKEVIFQTDVEGRWTFLNPAWTEITGFCVSETLGELFIDSVWPDDRPGNMAKFQEMLATGKEFCRHEVRYRNRAGSYVWIDVFARLVRDAQGEIIGTSGTLSDISERRRAHDALEQQKALLSHILSIIPYHTFWKDRNSVYLGCNDGFARSAGLSDNAEIMGKSDYDLPWTREEAETYRSIDRQVMDSGVPQLYLEETQRQSDGRVVTISTSKVPIRDAAGNISGILGIYSDITLRRNMEEELRRSRELLFRAFDESPIGMALFAPDGKILQVNRALSEMLGYPPEEILQKTFEALTYPPDRQASREHYEQVLSGRSKGFKLEKRYIHRDGRIVWGLLHVSLVRDLNDQPQNFVCQVEDITERKRSEEEQQKLASLIHASRDLIGMVSLDRKPFFLNEGGRRLVGLSNCANPSEFCLADFHPPETERLLAEQAFPTADRDGFWSGEGQVLHQETGEAIDVQMSVVLVRNLQTRQPICYAMVQSDVRALKRSAEALQQAKEAAEHANQAKSSFLANMSHEIRTPMSAIVGYADALCEADTTVQIQQECIAAIRRNARHLLELINDILDLSKIEADMMTVECIDTNLPRLLAETVSFMRPRAEEKGIGVELVFEGPVPRWVQTDPLRLKQVLMNLTGNAIKFTAYGKVCIAVACDRGSSQLILEVRDSGIGMTPEQMERLFRPFSQVDGSTTRRFGGTGLGLVISRRLTRLLGGDIAVESALGIGSRFKVTVRAGDLSQATFTEDTSEAVLAPTPTGKNESLPMIQARILLAEDGRDNQRLIASMLRKAGAEVTIAENGQIALDLEAAQDFDLILMDMQMPVLDGYGASQALRKHGYTGPIVALTAHAMADDRIKCLSAGCSDYLTKPVEKAVLLSTIAEHLQAERATADASDTVAVAAEGGTTTIASTSAAPALDATLLVSEYASDTDMVDLLEEFVAALPERVTELQTLLRLDDRAELRRLTHQLRGTAGGYGFMPITTQAARAEERLVANDELAAIGVEVEALVALIRRVTGYNRSRE